MFDGLSNELFDRKKPYFKFFHVVILGFSLKSWYISKLGKIADGLVIKFQGMIQLVDGFVIQIDLMGEHGDKRGILMNVHRVFFDFGEVIEI